MLVKHGLQYVPDVFNNHFLRARRRMNAVRLEKRFIFTESGK
jgi:hypothetical protein